VEPCEALFEHLYKLDGIVAVLNTAEGFYDQLSKKVVNGEKKVRIIIIK